MIRDHQGMRTFWDEARNC